MEVDERYGKDVKPEWMCSRCGCRNAASNEVCMASEMGDGRCGMTKPEPKEPICKCKTCRKSRTSKPLAQYLGEYLTQDVLTYTSRHGNKCLGIRPDALKNILEQALDAYESTENVKIKIEKQCFYP